MPGAPPLIVTAALDEGAFAWFEDLRQTHFPPERNRVPAHLTLFHALPGEHEPFIAQTLEEGCRRRRPLRLDVRGPWSIGRGVAYRLASPELDQLRTEAASAFAPWLTPQDRAPFRPHITVQNKADPAAARLLLERLQLEFEPFDIVAEALLVWRYLGGPWEPVARLPFSAPWLPPRARTRRRDRSLVFRRGQDIHRNGSHLDGARPTGAPRMPIDPPPSRTDEPDRPQLRRIIGDLSEGVILIETDRRIVWANPAALKMHGVAKMQDLGATVDAYAERFEMERRDGKPLDRRDYPAERLCRGEEFSDLVVHLADRTDPALDWFHKVRGLELKDETGRPDCYALMISDATEAFEAEERFERMFSANPAPALIVRTADLHYVRVNQGFLEMTGWRREDIIGRSLYDFDILNGAERKEIAKARLADWLTVPQMEAELDLPGGGSKLVIMAGHPVEFGASRCMIFTFADLEPKRRAESALRQSEEQFAKAFRLAPVPMTLSSLDGHRILDANHAFLQLTGWSYEAVIGRRPGEIEMWDSSATRREVEAQLADTGAFRGRELKVKTKAGDLVDCLVSAETATLRGEPCVMSVFQDISDRKRTELELITAIEAAMQDSSWLSRKIMDKLASLRSPRPSGEPPPPSAPDLTAREREVLALIAQGCSDAKIAQTLALSRNTVRNHVARLYGKIGAHSRAQAVVWARERGHVAPPKGGAGRKEK